MFANTRKNENPILKSMVDLGIMPIKAAIRPYPDLI